MIKQYDEKKRLSNASQLRNGCQSFPHFSEASKELKQQIFYSFTPPSLISLCCTAKCVFA